MHLKLFDLHCDTAAELFQSNQSLKSNDKHISLEKASVFHGYRQIMAIWSDNTLNDQAAFERFLEISDFLHMELGQKELSFPLLTSGDTLAPCGAFLAVEDARLLCDQPERLLVLFKRGVRFLTLVWGGKSRIGGAHDTSIGLTPFGRQVVRDCFALGMIPDISHASIQTAEEVLALAKEYGKPVIASHSDSFSVCPHSRNLTDRQFLSIGASGGIVGICLCPSHLARERDTVSVGTVLKHIEHFYALGGEDILALGCDLDGTDLPKDFSSVADLVLIADEMSKRGYSDKQIEKLFYKNAENFVRKNI